MNSVDFNRLRVFSHVYRTRSVTEAARELHITRSAVSQQIGKLEDELEVRLFLRTNRNVIPTSEAQALYPVVHEFIAKIDEHRTLFRLGKHEPVGTLRVGAPVIFGETFVIEAVASFRRSYPHVHFDLSFMNQPWELSRKVLEGDLDFAVVDLVDVAQKQIPVNTRHLIIEQQVVVGTKRLLGQWVHKKMPYSELIAFPFIAYIPEGVAEKLWFRYAYGSIPERLTIVFSCQNLHAMIRGVKEGLGLGLIPNYLIKREMERGQLVKVKTEKSDYENNIGLAQAPDRRPSLAEKLFIELIMDEIKKRGKYL
jgi:DNA-binding transcriptional LysR family regulator